MGFIHSLSLKLELQSTWRHLAEPGIPEWIPTATKPTQLSLLLCLQLHPVAPYPKLRDYRGLQVSSWRENLQQPMNSDIFFPLFSWCEKARCKIKGVHFFSSLFPVSADQAKVRLFPSRTAVWLPNFLIFGALGLQCSYHILAVDVGIYSLTYLKSIFLSFLFFFVTPKI